MKIRLLNPQFSKRLASSSSMSVESARNHCLELLKNTDRSSYLLKSYIPKPALDAYIGVRALNIDLARVADTVTKPELAKLRLEFWKSAVQKIYQGSDKAPREPACILLAHALEAGMILSKRYFLTLIQTREQFIANPPFRTLDSMASYGEGTYSQLNYLTQELALSVSPGAQKLINDLATSTLEESLRTIAAHIGQATGIAAYIRGFKFYVGNKTFVPLPVSLMTDNNISQQQVIDLSAGRLEGDMAKEVANKLSNVVFETATRANDHLLSAQSILMELKRDTGLAKLPNGLFVPLLSAVPVHLFLERLEKANFDVSNLKLANDWRLPYRSYKSYKLQTLN
jgi:NADH dehydrogenase [ubiquinone] 1 alpha subcomplex assembly factor 6